MMNENDRKRLLREMLFARRFEDRCFEAYMEHKIGGFLHLYPGQEACAHGVLEAARPGHDYVVASYRDHIHAIKCGVDPKSIMAELYGKETGCCKGRGGSMHIFSAEHRFMGGYAIVGGPFPIAAGIAKGIKIKGTDEICIVFIGDGAVSQGTFHETMNMAGLWKLPLLVICENNLYAIGTRIDRSTSGINLAGKLSGYGIPAVQADGQDIEVVYRTAVEAVQHVRAGNGPYFIEFLTYRHRGHSMSDSKNYRTAEEEREWQQKDPINILKEHLIKEGMITEEEFENMNKEIIKHIDENVIKYAEESPFPDVTEIEKYLFAEK